MNKITKLENKVIKVNDELKTLISKKFGIKWGNQKATCKKNKELNDRIKKKKILKKFKLN